MLISADPEILPEAYLDRNSASGDEAEPVDTQNISAPVLPPAQRKPVDEDNGELDTLDQGNLVATPFYNFKKVRVYYFDQEDKEIRELGKVESNRVLMDTTKIQILVDGVPINCD